MTISHPPYRKLNIGCGNDLREGFTNMDREDVPGIDVRHDINNLPLPFEDGAFDHILAKQVLDHVRCLPLLKELHRILAPGGTIRIEVVHFTSKRNYIDLQHVQLFSIDTFDFFVPTEDLYKLHTWYVDFTFSKYAARYIYFQHDSPIFFLNRFVERWVNSSKRHQQLYEDTFISRIFPAVHIGVTLVK